MASALGLRLTKASFLALPANVRMQAYQQTRTFSASSPRRLNLVDCAVAGPNAILDTIHSLGIPWSATIPVTAILVRTVLVHFISTRPARRRAQIRAQLLPLASARLTQEWNFGDKASRYKQLSPNRNIKRLQLVSERLQRMWLGMKVMRKVSKTFGVGGIRPWGLLNLGMLIAFTEAIRMKCGARQGLLPTLLSPFTWMGQKIAPSYFAEPPILRASSTVQPVVQDPAEILATKIWAAREALNTGTSTSEQVAVSSDLEMPDLSSSASQEMNEVAMSDMVDPYFDPSMQLEGPPWATDLTIADPTTILPITLLLGLSANAILRPRPGNPAAPENYRLLQGLNNGQRIGIVIAWVFAFASVNMPSAVVLYFGTSVVAGWLHGRWLDWKDPILPGIQPCKRPVRLDQSVR